MRGPRHAIGWRHAKGWRCPCYVCTADRIVNRIAFGVVAFAVFYFGAHVALAILT